ncbi:hypothetical protein ARSEF4850_009231, partial [Beauveria asiatica]
MPTTTSHSEAMTPRPRGLFSFLRDPWTQIIIVSFISFCNPGMYNALTGMGGSGQVDGTVAANSNVATHACTAGAALLLVGTLYRHLGPRASRALGGCTYALYAGALLYFTRSGNGAFVVAAGALHGHGLDHLSAKYTGTRMTREATQVTWASMRDTLAETTKVVLSWSHLCLYPMFFTANVFYSYQQNNVNGSTLTLRTRSLNGALYWMAQMMGGLLMCLRFW